MVTFYCSFFFFFFLNRWTGSNFYFYLFIYLWLRWVFVSARGPFSSCGKRGPLLIAVRRPLTIAAPPVAEHRLQTCRLSSCAPRAQPLRGMWDPPRPGLEPASPAPAGRLPTTAPPGKPLLQFFDFRTEIEIFLNKWDCPQPLLSNTDWLWKSAFSAELEIFLNEFNLELHGKIALICEI